MTTLRPESVLRTLAVCALLAFAVRSFSDNKADVDLWGNAGFVTSPPGTVAFLRQNTFSFTEPEHDWINHEWLAQYIFHRVHTFLGNPGLLVLKIGLGLLVLGVLCRFLRVVGPLSPARFLFLLLVVSTMGYGFSTRPHHFTYLLTAVLLLLLRQWPARYRLLVWLAPFLGVLWANLHGAFFIGSLALFLVAAVETVRAYAAGPLVRPGKSVAALWAAAVLFTAATFVNPYGWRLWTFVFQSAGFLRPYLSEWAVFDPVATFWSHTDFLVLAAIAGVAVWFPREGRSVTWIVLLAAAFAAAVLMRRNIPLFAIVAGFAVGPRVEVLAKPTLQRLAAETSRPLAVVFLAVFAAASLYYAATFHKTDPLQIEVPRDRFPVEAVRFLQENRIRGNALVFFDWAEYSIWKLFPSCRVFLDGRLDCCYSPQTIRDYLSFLYADEKDWQRALDNYPTDILLLHRDNPACRRVLGRADWIPVHQTAISVVFLKKTNHGNFWKAWKEGRIRFPKPVEPSLFP